MRLYIITNYWNQQGGDHGSRSEVFTTREEAESRMSDIKDGLKDYVVNNDAFEFAGNEKTLEIYDKENESNFDCYELSEAVIEIKL